MTPALPATRPSASVLTAFGAVGTPRPLPGGGGTSWRVGPLVLKPGDGALHQWWGPASAGLTFDGVRVPRPLTSTGGAWSVEGWTATWFLEGDLVDLSQPESWRRVIAAGRRFHEVVAHLPRSPFLVARRDPWAVADRAAWDEVPMDVIPELAGLADRLRRVPDPPGDAQVVHLDLTGNVLASPSRPPAVIDLSPYWRPVTYAEGVLVADVLCHHGATASTVDALDVPVEAVARALLFRLMTASARSRAGALGIDVADDRRRFQAAADAIGV